MGVIMCPTCKGTGIIEKTECVLDSIGKMFLNPPGHIGATVERTRFLEEHTTKVSYMDRCPNCGGSGCKWEIEPTPILDITIKVEDIKNEMS